LIVFIIKYNHNQFLWVKYLFLQVTWYCCLIWSNVDSSVQ